MVFSTYSSMEIGFTVAIFSLFLGHYPSLARSLSVAFSIVVMSAVLLCTRRKADFGTFRYEIEYGMYFVVALLMLAKSWEHYAIFLLFPFIIFLSYLIHTDSQPCIVELVSEDRSH